MKLLGNSLIYTGVSLLQKAIGFFLLPVYTAYLTASDYGLANVILSIVNFLTIFYLLALHGAGTRFEHAHRADPEKAKEIWGTLFIFITANAACLTLVLLAFRGWLIEPFLGGIPFSPYMTLGLVAVTFSPSYALFQSYLQSRQLGARYGLNNFCYFLVNMGLTLLFMIAFGMKAESILLALAATNAAFFAYTLFDFPGRISLRFRFAHLKASFAYSLPLIPHALAGWVMSLVDRILLNNLRDAAEVGIYSIGGQLGNIINVFTTSVNQAFVPWFFQKCEEGEEGRRRIARVSEAIVLAYSLCALSLSLFSPEVVLVMVTEEFRDAWRTVPFLSFAFVFGGVYYLFVNPLFIRRTGLVPIVTLTSAALGVVLNLVLIPRFGMMGAAASSLASMAVSSAVALALTNRYEPIGFRWARIYALACVPLALSFSVYLRLLLPPLPVFALKTAILAGTAWAGFRLYREEVAAASGPILRKLRLHGG